ncbi:MAG: sulfite oxidase-like oxidoreductase [Methanomassiliicoccales archaeon]|nr:MAG: sulfite oxidase-like oxidoreductase [Methanomassiliicoccales archaeon]
MNEEERIPPGQKVTEKFPVLHEGSVPEFDQKEWDFRVEGLVENSVTMSWKEFRDLPKAKAVSDFHCVTGWSRLENEWEGVRFRELVKLASPKANARFVTVVAEGGYTTSLSLEDMMDEDVLLASQFEGEPLPPEHGGPLRLVVPKKYAYKSAKWVRKVVFTEEKELGYWEKRGYSDSADPWKEERYS